MINQNDGSVLNRGHHTHNSTAQSDKSNNGVCYILTFISVSIFHSLFMQLCVCGCASKSVCGLCAVVCEYFESFQSSPVCGLCAVVCEDFEFFKVPLCVKLCPCTGDFPLCWRDWFFRVKIPSVGAVRQ